MLKQISMAPDRLCRNMHGEIVMTEIDNMWKSVSFRKYATKHLDKPQSPAIFFFFAGRNLL